MGAGRPVAIGEVVEVLEATENSADNALAGGGFYSPEGFPFSNM